MCAVASASYSVEGLKRAMSDVHYANHGGLFKPDYRELLIRLYELRQENDALLPRAYQSAVLNPLIKFLEELKREPFNHLFESREDQLTREQR
ncbi:unnamed protein product, partial [marine sediment metagenome]